MITQLVFGLCLFGSLGWLSGFHDNQVAFTLHGTRNLLMATLMHNAIFASFRGLIIDGLRACRNCVHIFFLPKWKKIYKDDAYHLGLLLRTLSIDHVIDVGAATGQFALSIRRNGYRYKITSIEPLQFSWEKLYRRAKHDRLWRVLDRSALGGSTKLMSINRSANNDSSSFLPVTSESIFAAPKSAKVTQETVQIHSLDDLFEDIVSQGDTVLLKLDVQGYEGEVIRGASESIKHIKAALLEVSIVPMYENQPTYLEIISALAGLGFEPFAFFKGFCNEETGRQLQIDILFLNKSLA